MTAAASVDPVEATLAGTIETMTVAQRKPSDTPRTSRTTLSVNAVVSAREQLAEVFGTDAIDAAHWTEFAGEGHDFQSFRAWATVYAALIDMAKPR